MNAKSRITAWLLALILMGLAAALTYAEESIYIEGAVGRTMLDDSLSGLPIEDDATSARFGIGYDFGNNFAVEVGYQSLGELEDALVRGEVDGVSAAARFSLPVSDSLTMSAKGGMFFWDAEIETTTFQSKSDGDDLFYGIGLGFEFSEQLSFKAEWDRYEFDDADADVLWAGVSFRF